jgi:hypothetical protein
MLTDFSRILMNSGVRVFCKNKNAPPMPVIMILYVVDKTKVQKAKLRIPVFS